MKQDLFGQGTTLNQDSSLQNWNAAQLAFLSHGAATPTHLAAVLSAEPDFALGHAVKGMFLLLLGRREMVASAEQALRDAEAGARATPITLREARFVTALALWLAGSPLAAVGEIDKGLDAAPDDALAMKLAQAIRFVLGDSGGMRRSVEQVMPAYGHDHPARGYLLGCHAFALEETGDYHRAEIVGRQALWTAPDDAWGLHAVAHVHDMTGRARQGLDWLSGREAAWAHCNNFRYHVWWHKALMHLDLGEIDAVLDLYDREVRRDKTDDYRDISNATSLLMRLELDGVSVGNRWEELAEFSAARTEDGCLIFADLHYLLALTQGDRALESQRLIKRICDDAAGNGTENQTPMAAPGRDAAQGLGAFSEGRYSDAFQHLARARSTMLLAGGSHAQRDVFERITIDAALRSGLFVQAENLLTERSLLRGGTQDSYCIARRYLMAEALELPQAERVPAR